MAKLVAMLKGVCLQQPPGQRGLFYRGLVGAALLIEYSKDILDLDVSIVRENGEIFPVKGVYDTAQGGRDAFGTATG